MLQAVAFTVLDRYERELGVFQGCTVTNPGWPPRGAGVTAPAWAGGCQHQHGARGDQRSGHLVEIADVLAPGPILRGWVEPAERLVILELDPTPAPSGTPGLQVKIAKCELKYCSSYWSFPGFRVMVLKSKFWLSQFWFFSFTPAAGMAHGRADQIRSATYATGAHPHRATVRQQCQQQLIGDE